MHYFTLRLLQIHFHNRKPTRNTTMTDLLVTNEYTLPLEFISNYIEIQIIIIVI